MSRQGNKDRNVVMEKSLRVLVIEDSADDAALLIRELKRGGYDVIYELVDSSDALNEALNNKVWDVILSDYAIPGFGGVAALKIMQEKGLDLPFILISGTIGEEAAVQAMKAGVHDYFSKDKLALLVPAIERELREADDRHKRREAEEGLRQSEERYRLLFESNPQPMWVYDPATLGIIAVNESAIRHYGYSRQEFLSMTIKDLRPPEDIPNLIDFLQLGIKESGDNGYWRHRKKDGSVILVAITANMMDFAGKEARLIVASDVTEQVRAEEQRQQLERERAQILENMPVGCIVLDRDFRHIYWNPTAEAIFGYKQQEILGKTPFEVTVALEFRSEVESTYAALVNGQTVGPDVRENLTRDGQRITCEWVNAPLFDSSGAFAGVIAMVQDITERQRMDEIVQRLLEQQIAINELAMAMGESGDLRGNYRIIYEKVREVMDVELFAVASYDEDKQQIEARYAIFQGSEADISNVPPLPLTEGQGSQSQAIHTGKPVYVPDLLKALKDSVRAYTVDKDGSILEGPLTELDEEISRSAVYVPMKIRGKIIGVMQAQSFHLDAYTQEDITLLSGLANVAAIAIHNARLIEELQRSGEALEKAVEERTQELYEAKIHVETILNNSSDAIIMTDENALISQTNPAFNALFDVEPDALFQMPLETIFEPEQADMLAAALESARSGHTIKREMMAHRTDDTSFPADVALTWIYDEARHRLNLVCALHDTTEHKRAALELRLALDKEKELSELKSRFVSMVSHEFRNPLATIQSSSDLIKEYGHRMTDQRKLEHLQKIQAQVRRLVDMLNDILTISKAQTVGLEFNPLPLDVEAFCEEIIEEMRLVDETHELVFTTKGNCPQAMIDDKLVRKIIANLLSNALKYSPEKSTVTLKLSCDDRNITLQVQDQGIGIPQEDQARMFEVFHRASNVGSVFGTGLGLAIIKQAVERHSGRISFESQVDVGTTFTVTLPIVQA
jgi:PAS domain S-box-containing protein